jgi:hypothetical protein
MLSHSNLATYYRMNFDLAQHHKWDISTIENMLPFERDLYFDMLIEYLERKKDEQ